MRSIISQLIFSSFLWIFFFSNQKRCCKFFKIVSNYWSEFLRFCRSCILICEEACLLHCSQDNTFKRLLGGRWEIIFNKSRWNRKNMVTYLKMHARCMRSAWSISEAIIKNTTTSCVLTLTYFAEAYPPSKTETFLVL